MSGAKRGDPTMARAAARQRIEKPPARRSVKRRRDRVEDIFVARTECPRLVKPLDLGREITNA
jgi:hypothetical protein